ncbi:MAG: class B sortase, partial [Oscillospiraceae bacterium]|nr:class B sortase [Oscillospiraceae bacterium]
LCLILVAFSGCQLYGIFSEYAVGENAYENLTQQVVTEPTPAPAQDESGEEPEPFGPPLEIDLNTLRTNAPDAVGWIYCDGTPINYPFVQADDNDYYLYRLPDGRSNSSGSIFMDYRNSPDFSDLNTFLYGHNMKNGSMFASLMDYKSQEFYEEHPYMWVYTNQAVYQMELLLGFVTEDISDAYRMYETEEELHAYLNDVARKSTFRNDTDLNTVDRIVTLSTCSYEYDSARYVVIGRLIRWSDNG